MSTSGRYIPHPQTLVQTLIDTGHPTQDLPVVLRFQRGPEMSREDTELRVNHIQIRQIHTRSLPHRFDRGVVTASR